MSSSGPKFFTTGTVTGTGSELKVTNLPFTPRKVVLRNVDSGDTMEWTLTMGYGAGFKRLANGTGALVTTGGVTPVYQNSLGDGSDPARGFLIGDDSDINANTEVIHWEAWE
jgi:hypothetical protein